MACSAAVPPTVHSHTAALTTAQATQLQEILKDRGFEFLEKPYTIFAARKDKLSVTVYEKGPKVLVQGKGLEDFIRYVLEPEVLQEATFGYEEELQPERFAPHFGIDETGKGDFFGPLVVAGVYVNTDLAREFRELGIADSKRITSDARIRALAGAIRKTRAPSSLIMIKPLRYNELIHKFGNVNRLLAWGHARVIENLCDLVPECPTALSDQFANPAVLQRAMQSKGSKLELRQQTKAESDPAVAAASILAREALINWFAQTAEADGEGEPYPRGASALVKKRAVDLVRRRGRDFLPGVVKMHFKTAAEVLAESSL
jgi:ribonuclease HIII